MHFFEINELLKFRKGLIIIYLQIFPGRVRNVKPLAISSISIMLTMIRLERDTQLN